MEPEEFAEFVASDDVEGLGRIGDRFRALGHLYRYRSLDGPGFARVYDIAARSVMFYAEYGRLNDPFDGRVFPNVDGTDAQKRRVLAAMDVSEEGIVRFLNLSPEKQAEFLQEGHERFVGEAGVVSFVPNNKDILMWSHYADSHRGVCLQFDAARLLGGDAPIAPYPVMYEDHHNWPYFAVSPFKRTVIPILTKAPIWSHEAEWRVVNNKAGYYPFNAGALDGIIMGFNISDEDEKRMWTLRASAGNSFELFRARPLERRFELEVVPA